MSVAKDSRVRFAIRLIQYVGSPRETVELAARAERAGFDAVWLPHDTFMANTWVLTGAIARATSRIEIGSVGTNPYTTDPSEIATFAATLDSLSGGRCLLGLGLHTSEMVEWTGIDAGDHLTRTREAAELIRALLRGQRADRVGECFHWTEQCYLRFAPLRADLPIYISAFGPEFLELAGAIGDGALPMITPPACAAYMVPLIRRGLARNPAPQRFVISGCAWLSLSETPQAAATTLRDMIAYFGPYLEDDALAAVNLRHTDFLPIKAQIDRGNYAAARKLVDERMLALGIVGTPADVIGQIETVVELGINEVNLGGPLGPDPGAAIDLMGRTVIPHFR